MLTNYAHLCVPYPLPYPTLGERQVDVIQCCKGDLYVTTTYCPVVSGHQTGQITYSRDPMTCAKVINQ